MFKVLSMNHNIILQIMLKQLLQVHFELSKNIDFFKNLPIKNGSVKCEGFLCAECDDNESRPTQTLCLYSLMYVAINIGMGATVIIPALKQDAHWSSCLDRRQVIIPSSNINLTY